MSIIAVCILSTRSVTSPMYRVYAETGASGSEVNQVFPMTFQMTFVTGLRAAHMAN